MGADLIIFPLATKKAVNELDWDAGFAAIKELHHDPEQFWDIEFQIEEWDDDLPDKDQQRLIREKLEKSLSLVRDIITGGSRDLTGFPFGDWTFYIYGQTSWGDVPDGFDDIVLIADQAPAIAKAVGFDWLEKEDE